MTAAIIIVMIVAVLAFTVIAAAAAGNARADAHALPGAAGHSEPQAASPAAGDDFEGAW